MSEDRPTSLYAIAVLNLVVGVFGVLVDSASTVSIFAERTLAARYLDDKQQFERAQIESVLAKELPHLPAYRLVFNVAIPWLLTLALLASGVGLLRLKAWGWWLAILYGCASLLHKVGMGIYTVVFLLPAYRELPGASTDMPFTIPGTRHVDALSTADTATSIVMVAMPFVLSLYPVAVLVVLSQPRVTAAFAPKPALVEQPA